MDKPLGPPNRQKFGEDPRQANAGKPALIPNTVELILTLEALLSRVGPVQDLVLTLQHVAALKDTSQLLPGNLDAE